MKHNFTCVCIQHFVFVRSLCCCYSPTVKRAGLVILQVLCKWHILSLLVQCRARPPGGVNTWSHIGFCSDTELFTNEMRAKRLPFNCCNYKVDLFVFLLVFPCAEVIHGGVHHCVLRACMCELNSQTHRHTRSWHVSNPAVGVNKNMQLTHKLCIRCQIVSYHLPHRSYVVDQTFGPQEI